MGVHKLLTKGILLFSLFSFSMASYSSYDIVSNLTHTCKISPMIVCVDVIVVNQTCVDLECLINSGGNHSACASALLNVTLTNGTSANITSSNGTSTNNITNTTTAICNGTWVYPSNQSLCLNTTSWNKTVCELSNVTCKVNSTQCTLNDVFYIGGFFNLKHLDGWGNLPAAQLATNEINHNSTYLTNITLSLTAEESTQGLLSHGTQLLYTYLNSGPPKLMLLLPQENELARTVAAYTGLKQWGALQFSYGTTDKGLASNKKLFPRFFRLNPVEISYNRLRVAFVRSFPNWKDDIGLLYFANTYYEEVNADLRERLEAKGFKIVANIGFRSSPEEALNILKEKNAHIILTSFPYTYGKALFCQAYKLEMYGPHFVWITYGLMPYKFWVPSPTENLGCSEYEMTCTAENHFSFTGAKLDTSSLISEPNVTFFETYNKTLVDLGNSIKNRTDVARYAYDAVWTIADILRRARATVEGRGKALFELNYNDVNETELFAKLAYETDFIGTTGRIRFFENGNRKFDMNVLQVRSNGYGYFVGSYDEDSDVYTPSGILWQGGLPYERTTTTYQWRNIEFVLFVFWCILASIGILYAVFCFVFVIIYRRERSIKYSSPTISLCIILGCLLNFITVILYGVDYQRTSESRMSTLCKVRLWVFSLGFTLCIGGLWVKVWTLYRILIERRVDKKRIMEYWMFGIVVVFIIIDIIYLSIWTATDGLYRTVETLHDQPVYECFQKISGNPFRVTISYVEICDCDNLALWLGIFLAYKALVLLYGFYMSWKVRTVYTRKLIDAQYCAILLILALPFCFLGLIFALTLRLHPTPHYGLLGIIIIIYSFIVLIALFGHKVINIFCVPRNKIKVRSKDTSSRKQCSCCPSGLYFCFIPLCSCCSGFTALCCCCKGLWDALTRGPRKNRGSFAKDSADHRMDYQIGAMPGDRERQIIILQKELEKKEQEIRQLRSYQLSKQAVKQTQTTGFFYNNSIAEGSSASSSGRSNESFEDDNNMHKRRSGKPQYNRFKVYHRKLDFSHVNSKVDSGLEGKSVRRIRPIETPVNGSGQWTPNSQDSEILSLQRALHEREKELSQLRAYLGMASSPSVETLSKIGSLASIGEESTIPKEVVPKETDGIAPDQSISSVVLIVDDNDPTKATHSQKTQSDVEIFDSSDSDVRSRLGQDTNGSVSLHEVNANHLKVPQDYANVNSTVMEQGLRGNDDQRQENNGKEKENGKNEQSGKRSDVKIRNPSSNVSRSYASPYNNNSSIIFQSSYNSSIARKPGRFQKKVLQLRSFGILKTQNTNITNTTIKVAPSGDLDNGRKQDSENSENHEQNQAKENEQNLKSRSNVKIFNAPTDYSHVKSRLLDIPSNSDKTASRSSGSRKSSMTGNEDNRNNNNNNQNSKENNENSKSQSNIKIFNATSDYSHVKSRLLDIPSNNDAKANQTNVSRSNSRTGNEDGLDNGSIRRRQNQIDQEVQDNHESSKSRSNLKIFNAPSDYSHVKSRLFDSSLNSNANGSATADIPTERKRSRAGDEDELDNDENSLGVRNEQEQGKENARYSKNRTNVKIFNSPSDYSHVRSRLFDASSSRDNNQGGPQSRRFKRKVNQWRSFGVLKHNSSNVPKNQNNAAMSGESKAKNQDSSV